MVFIILGNGFEEIEAISPGDVLKRGGVPVCYVSAEASASVVGAHGISVCTDCAVQDVTVTQADTILIPGGMGGVDSIKACHEAMKLIGNAAQQGASLSAICAGPAVLARLNLLEGKHITCYPGCEDMMTGAVCHCDKSVVTDGNLITARAPGSAIDLGLELLKHIKGEACAEKVLCDLVY